MTNTYRNQNQYKGQCAKCGKTCHSIAKKCFKATDKEKQDFFIEVKGNKANFKPVKKSDMLTMLKPMMGLSPILIDGVGQM